MPRVLTAGSWEAVRWLRSHLGDSALKEWIVARRGRGLGPRRLRFWELILHLPRRQVSTWLAEQRGQPWHDRLHR